MKVFDSLFIAVGQKVGHAGQSVQPFGSGFRRAGFLYLIDYGQRIGAEARIT